MFIKNPVAAGTGGNFTVDDDGTTLTFKVNGVTRWKQRKSDNQMLWDAAADDDAF